LFFTNNSKLIFLPILAQTQNAVHVIQIGNSFYDVIPIANPSSSSVSRCHHHSYCRRSYIRHSTSNSSLNLNAHTNPTFVLDEGIYPSGIRIYPNMKHGNLNFYFCPKHHQLATNCLQATKKSYDFLVNTQSSTQRQQLLKMKIHPPQ
jgi:hypothetical protein